MIPRFLPLAFIAVLALIVALAGCSGAPPTKSHAQIACDAWKAAEDAAVVAGLFAPGVESAAVLIADFVDPVCLAVAAGKTPADPATPQWIHQNAAKLNAITEGKNR
jgi:hypothetical protein